MKEKTQTMEIGVAMPQVPKKLVPMVDVNEGKMRLLSKKRAEGEEARREARSE